MKKKKQKCVFYTPATALMSIRKKSSLPRLARLRGLNRMNSQLVSDILELLNGLRFGFVVVCHDCLYGTFFL